MKDLIIVGGGAAGIFAALSAKEEASQLNVVVIEKHNVLLSKVRISGGGRCNVTHACYDPRNLASYYPRGHKELIAPFHVFQPRDTIEWFKKKGVELKVETDGRIFPVSDSSSTIIACLLGAAKDLGVEIVLNEKIESIHQLDSHFQLTLKNKGIWTTKSLLLATGSGREGYVWAKQLGHTIQEPIPSLFTFNIPSFPLHHLSGISVENVEIKILDCKTIQKGPLLITHFGLSGPAVLKLSAFEARLLHAKNYKATVVINWLSEQKEERTFEMLQIAKKETPHKMIQVLNPFHLPKKLWRALLEETSEQKLVTFSNKRLRQLAQKLHADIYYLDGKTTNKEEFVTCGGVSLNEIDFKTMGSKKCPGLFFAGEVLDIDGITGGFNFQSAWTTGYIAGKNACS